MATYIPNVTDTNLDPVLYTPDYSFLRYALGKKTAQYEQGLKTVSSTYNSLKADLSDAANVEKRDTFLKAADAQLQKLASADLSLQSNVNAANSVFQPLATDKAFIYDSYYTKFNKNQLSTMETWASSEDPEKRKLYSQDVYNWVSRDLNSIKTANGDVSKYKVQGRKAVAFENPQDIIDKAVKDKGFVVEKDWDGGTYIVKRQGGVTFRDNYEKFAQEVLSSHTGYQRQTEILGENKYESIIEDYRKQPAYTNWDSSTILNDYFSKTYDNVKNRTRQQLDVVKGSIDKDKAELTAFENANADKIAAGGPEKTMLEEMLLQVEAKKQEYNNQNKQFESDYGDNESVEAKRKAFVERAAKSPKGHFASQYMQNDVITFSNIRSSFGKTTFAENKAYFDAFKAKNDSMKLLNDIKDDNFDNQVNAGELSLKERAQAFKEARTKAGTGTGTETGTTTEGGKKATSPDFEYSGVSNTEITKTQGLTVLQDKITTNFETSRQLLTGAGGALSILQNMGLAPEKVALVREYFDNHFENGGLSKGRGTKEQNEALAGMYTTIRSFAKQNGKDELLAQLDKLHGKDVNTFDYEKIFDLALSNFKGKTVEEAAYAANWVKHKSYMEAGVRSANLLKSGRDLVINAVKDNEEYKNYIVKKADGTTGIYSGEDAVKDLAGMPLPKGLTKEMIKEAYDNGTLQHSVVSTTFTSTGMVTNSTDPVTTLKLNGKAYEIPGTYRLSMPLSKRAELEKKINSQISMPSFPNVNEAGVILTLNNAVKDNVLKTLGASTMSNSNMWEYDGDNKPRQVDPAEQNLMRGAMLDEKSLAENGVQAITKSPINGGPAIKVTFRRPVSDADKKDPLLGRTIYLPINPNDRNTDNLKILTAIGNEDEFSENRRTGKAKDFNHYEGYGIKVVMQPTKKNAEDGQILIYQKPWNDQTKSFGEEFVQLAPVTYDLSKRSYREWADFVESQILSQYVQKRISFEQSAKPNVNNNSTISYKNRINAL